MCRAMGKIRLVISKTWALSLALVLVTSVFVFLTPQAVAQSTPPSLLSLENLYI